LLRARGSAAAAAAPSLEDSRASAGRPPTFGWLGSQEGAEILLFPSGVGREGMEIEDRVACFVALLPCLQLKGKMGMGIVDRVACFGAFLHRLQLKEKVGMGTVDRVACFGAFLPGTGIVDRVACFVAHRPRLQLEEKVGMDIVERVACFVALLCFLSKENVVGMGEDKVGDLASCLDLMGKERDKVALLHLGGHHNQDMEVSGDAVPDFLLFQDIQMVVEGTSLEGEFPEATSPFPPSLPRPGLSSPVPLDRQHSR